MMNNMMNEKELDLVNGGAANQSNYYTIKGGDTLSGIAVKFHTTVDTLLALNPQIKNRDLIYAGNTIRIR